MGFTLAIWLGCDDISFPFTYVFIIHFFILFVKTYSHLTFHTLIFPLYQQAERKISLRLFRFLKIIIQHLTLNIRKIVTSHNCTYHSKNRRCDTTALIRNIPETFLRDWDYPSSLPFIPSKAMFARTINKAY